MVGQKAVIQHVLCVGSNVPPTEKQLIDGVEGLLVRFFTK